MPPKKEGNKGEKKPAKKDKNKKPKEKKIRGGGTVGYVDKAERGKYYNVVESLDDLICPPVPQLLYTDDAARAPREPPCCPPSSCCYPPPYCPRQPGRRCC